MIKCLFEWEGNEEEVRRKNVGKEEERGKRRKGDHRRKEVNKRKGVSPNRKRRKEEEDGGTLTPNSCAHKPLGICERRGDVQGGQGPGQIDTNKHTMDRQHCHQSTHSLTHRINLPSSFTRI
jgi:hypothetical protein